MRHPFPHLDAIQPWPTKREHYIRDANRGVNEHIDEADIDIGDVPQPIIPDDEPVFLLRAKDKLAPHIVWQWAQMLRSSHVLFADHPDPCPTCALADRVEDWADEMDGYARENYDGGKLPDVPDGMLR